jgi:hypothetical protein
LLVDIFHDAGCTNCASAVRYERKVALVSRTDAA